MHQSAVAWLREELETGDPGKTVVVTHQAPHRGSVHARHENDLLTAGYASDLTHLMGRSMRPVTELFAARGNSGHGFMGLIQGAQHRIKKLGAKVVKLSVNPDAKSTKSGLKFETSDR